MAKRVGPVVLLGVSVLAVAAVAYSQGFFEAGFLEEAVFAVTYRAADGEALASHAFAVAPVAGPLASFRAEPLALNVDKERYGRIAAIDVEVRGHITARDLAENRVDVEVDVQWANAHGATGEATGEETLEEKKDRFSRRALVSERFTLEWEPLVSGAANVCGGVADNAVPQSMNVTANIEAHAVHKTDGDVYGYATQAYNLVYDCSPTDAGLKLTVLPGTFTIVDAAGERAVPMRPYATAYVPEDA